ncbi:MAG TPA: discoidin domain-containing protein [Patescibacteria group bacterium]|nr:discoidin domain-containing protein [Patescibacteria group bacterium]
MMILIALILIIAISSIPLYSWPKTRKLLLPVALLYAAFIALHWSFIQGRTGTWHDTLQNLQSLFNLTNQLVVSGIRPEWNPYMGGGYPICLMANLSSWTPVALLAQLYKLIGFHFNAVVFCNLCLLCILFLFYNGSLLLLQLLYRDDVVTIVGFSALLFSDFFNVSAGQPAGIINVLLLPYLLFFLIHSFRARRWASLFFFSLVLGISANYYIPTYITISIIVILLAMTAAFPRDASLWLGYLARKKPTAILACALLFLTTAGPALFSYHEMKEYISPTRGFTERGFITPGNPGFQPAKEAPLSAYVSLFNRKNPEEGLEWIHGAFYIGLIPSLLLFLALLSSWGAVFLVSAAFFIILGQGYSTPIWPWLMTHIPLFGITRHPCIFAPITGFCLLIGSMAGLKNLLNPKIAPTAKIPLIILPGLLLFVLQLVPQNQALTLLWVGIVFISFAAVLIKKNSPSRIILALGLLVTFHLLEVVSFSADKAKRLPTADGLTLADFRYPDSWTSVSPLIIHLKPIDYTPAISKQIVWANPQPNNMFLLHKEFAKFLEQLQLISRPAISGRLFYLIPDKDSWKADLPSLANLTALPMGFLCSVEASSANNSWETPDRAIDTDPGTYWHVRTPKDSPVAWLAFVSSIPLKVSAVRITPRQGLAAQFWSGDHAQLQISHNGRDWEMIKRLDLNQAGFDGTDKPILFRFPEAVSSRFFRLYIEDENFYSLSEVELIGNNTLQDRAARCGQIRQNPSDNPNRISLDADITAKAYLLRMENYHPNWKVYFNGRQGRIEPAAGHFQMVELPPGKYRITFVFASPYPFLVAIHIIAAAAGWILLAYWLARRQA